MYHSSSRGTESLKDNCSRVCTYFQTAVRSFKCHQNFMLFKVHLFFGRRLYYLFKYQWSEIDLPWKMILIAFESLVGYLTVRVGNIIVLELIVVRLRGPMAPRELGPPSTFFTIEDCGWVKETKQNCEKDEKWIGSARPGQMSLTNGVPKPSHRPGFFFFSSHFCLLVSSVEV